MLKISFRAMGCQMEAMTASETAQAQKLLIEVPGWFEEWEMVLSRFHPGSELTRLNNHPEVQLSISDILAEALQNALEMEGLSAGLVSPTVLHAVVASGYDRSFELIGSLSSELWPESVHWMQHQPKELLFNQALQTVRLPYGAGLDLGGTAKGWAADRAAVKLSEVGPALVNAGGDIAVNCGGDFDYAWSIAIHDPLEKREDLGVLILREGGIATSGRDHRHWNQGGLKRHHIIDPRIAEPARTDILAATAIAPTAAEAEMAAKTAFILGSQKGLEWLEERSPYAGLLVLENGELQETKNLSDYQDEQLWKTSPH